MLLTEEYLPGVIDCIGHIEAVFSKTTSLSKVEVARLVTEWRALRRFHTAWCREASVMDWPASDALISNGEPADEVAIVVFEQMISIASVLKTIRLYPRSSLILTECLG